MSKLTHFALASAVALALAAGEASAAEKPAAKPAAAAAPYKWPGLPPGAAEEMAAMRDGTKLAANVFKPAGPGPWPVVMTRTPYLKDGRIDPEKDPKGVKMREALEKQAKHYTDAGYVFVLQDVRGKGRSQASTPPSRTTSRTATTASNGRPGSRGATARSASPAARPWASPPTTRPWPPRRT